jgi:hypothetical protein
MPFVQASAIQKGLCAMTELHFLKPNRVRGAWGFIGMALVAIGAGILWGWGAALMAIGLLLWVDLTMDELVERVTLITKWPDDAR